MLHKTWNIACMSYELPLWVFSGVLFPFWSLTAQVMDSYCMEKISFQAGLEQHKGEWMLLCYSLHCRSKDAFCCLYSNSDTQLTKHNNKRFHPNHVALESDIIQSWRSPAYVGNNKTHGFDVKLYYLHREKAPIGAFAHFAAPGQHWAHLLPWQPTVPLALLCVQSGQNSEGDSHAAPHLLLEL